MGYWAFYKIKDGSFVGTERFAVDLFLRDVLGRINDLQAGADGRTLDGDELYPGEGNLPFVGLITSLSARGERIALSLSVRNRCYWKLPPKR